MNKPLKWFYFVWVRLRSGEVGGAQMLPMEEEFDLLYAHQWIEKNCEEIGVITYYREVSLSQVAGFKIFTDRINKESGGAKRKLSLVRTDV